MKRVLVTGAAGFIGRNTHDPLRARGFEVHGTTQTVDTLESVDVFEHRIDLLDPAQVQRLVRDVAPSHLLHLAWYTERGKYWNTMENLDWVAASLTLARAFYESGGRRLVMVGSCAEYDWAALDRRARETPREMLRCNEWNTPCEPATLYGISKKVLYTLISEFNDRLGVSGAWARLFFLYGPAEDPRRLVASVIRSLILGEPAECTHGEQVRDYLHVLDAGAALAALIDSDVEGPVNVASGKAVPLKEILSLLGERCGRRDLIRLGGRPTPRGEPPVLVADTKRLNDEVGWEPAIDLNQGLEATIEWYKDLLKCGSS